MNTLAKVEHKGDAMNLDKWYSDTIHETAREIEKRLE